MQLISVSLLCYLNSYALKISHRNEIVNLEFSLRMSDIELANNFDSWCRNDNVNKFSMALETFGKLVPHYLNLIKPQEKELDEEEVRAILNLPSNIYYISLDEWISLTTNK